MSVLACEDIAREKLEYDKLPHNDALVLMVSVSMALQNVELTTQCL